MEFSLTEQLFLAVFEGVLRVNDLVRDRPRMFWAAWLGLSALAAVYLLRPGADSDAARSPKR